MEKEDERGINFFALNDKFEKFLKSADFRGILNKGRRKHVSISECWSGR